jgi:hypothetical protein
MGWRTPEPPPLLSQSMADDLRAVEMGQPFRTRSWRERPWRPGTRVRVTMRGGLFNHEYRGTVTAWRPDTGMKIQFDDEPELPAGFAWEDIFNVEPE